jgi:hypothetical protein
MPPARTPASVHFEVDGAIDEVIGREIVLTTDGM